MTSKVWTFLLSGGGTPFQIEVEMNTVLSYDGNFAMWKFFGSVMEKDVLLKEVLTYCHAVVYSEEESLEVVRMRKLLSVFAKFIGQGEKGT